MLYLAWGLLYTFLFLFGAVIASFINVLAYRLPRKKNPFKGRSFCPSCEHPLAAADLVPILSYLSLKRRCRYCGAPISPRYALVEALGGGLAALCYWRAQSWPVFALYAAAAFVLLTAALIDHDTQEIPNGCSVALLLCGVAAIWLQPQIGLVARLIGVFVVSVPLLLLSLWKPGAFGGGDIKLVGAAGLLLGYAHTLFGFFVAILLGGGYAVYLLACKKTQKGAHMAFGPYLSAGILVALLFGADILIWYFSFF